MKLVLVLLFSTLTSGALELPAASDYDKTPQQVFNQSQTLSIGQGTITNSLKLSLEIPEFKVNYFLGFQQPSINIVNINFSQEQATDWSGLVDLNNQAQSAWTLSLEEYKGDEARLKQDYLEGRLLPVTRSAVLSLHQSVGLFLISTPVQEFSLNHLIKCTHNSQTVVCPDVLSKKVESLKTLVFGYKEGVSPYDKMISDYSSLLDRLPEKRFHPYLTQALLEYLSLGYPLNYGTYTCGGVRCLLFPRKKIVLESDDISWSLRGYDRNAQGEVQRTQIMNYVQALMNEFFSSKSLPTLLDSDLANPKVKYLRQGMAASRILNHIGATPLTCADWGLWPKATVSMLGILAQSSHKIGNKDFITTDLDILTTRLSRSCGEPVVSAQVRPGSMDRGEGLIDISTSQAGEKYYVSGPDATAMIGAWRKLLSRQLQ